MGAGNLSGVDVNTGVLKFMITPDDIEDVKKLYLQLIVNENYLNKNINDEEIVALYQSVDEMKSIDIDLSTGEKK